MVSVPGFLLRRLYVKESLRNTPNGFEFQLMNKLGSGYTHGMSPLIVDGVEQVLSRSFFILNDQETAFDQISRDNTFTLAMNKAITVWVDGVTLEPGARKIGMGFDVPGLGTLKFDFTDVIE
ncbi:MAG: hypothetical protein BZY79_02450 [SAR202 cluster bacterium Casp-Chloro-G4]|nr:hypothetical protein [Chloroflexota bacterium]MDA1228004.1 hypothetical protein [Chloroflexota bacterium]PKB61691.1 MAG: hypothetical protein BZY79_02450 [SAR202 cluster bacterium Casp-Chloro-G4]